MEGSICRLVQLMSLDPISPFKNGFGILATKIHRQVFQGDVLEQTIPFLVILVRLNNIDFFDNALGHYGANYCPNPVDKGRSITTKNSLEQLWIAIFHLAHDCVRNDASWIRSV
jgi:hypothetical protein